MLRIMKKLLIVIIAIGFGISHIYSQYKEIKLINNSSNSDQHFGWTCDISQEFCIISSIRDNSFGTSSGAVYIFKNENGTWNKVQNITEQDADAFNYFGYAIALNGHYFVTSSIGSNSTGFSSGKTYIYQYINNRWELLKTFSPSGKNTDFAQFGFSLGFCNNFLLVGAPGYNNNQGRVYVYKKQNDNWALDKIIDNPDNRCMRFGNNITLNNNFFAVSTSNNNHYINYTPVFIYNLSDCSLMQIIEPEQGKYSRFGSSITFSENYLAISDPYATVDKDETYLYSGNVRIYKYDINKWILDTLIENPVGNSQDLFGTKVKITDDMLVISSPGNDENKQNSGKVFVYKNNKVWQQMASIIPSDNLNNDYFGLSLGLLNNTLIITAPVKSNLSEDYDIAYLYTLNTVTPENDFGEIFLEPNPASSNTKIIIILENIEKIQVHIYDVTGKKVVQEIYNGTPSFNEITIDTDLSNLGSGMYFIVVKSQNWQIMNKLIVNR